MPKTNLNIEEHLTFAASTPDGEIDFTHSEFTERVGAGFNEHGVRENTDDSGSIESVDVIFEAMEPGPPERRNGVRITEDFLENVAGKDYSPNPPHLKDHDDKDTFARIGEVRDAWFSDRLGKLMLMTRTPNIEGSQNHSEAIARYTHNPPAIRDGSLGFGNNYEAVMNDSGEPEMRDGKFREFSTVNFPGGYDEGGVNTAFAEAIDDVDFSEHGEDIDMEELEQVYNRYQSLVNMNEEQMEMWENHPCSDEGVDGGEDHRDNFFMLAGQPMEEWGMEALQVANRAIDFMVSETEKDPEAPQSGGPGTCPSRWAVNLLNRGHNPFDGFPSGNPQFDEDVVAMFDDSAEDEDKPDENLATGFAVKTESYQI